MTVDLDAATETGGDAVYAGVAVPLPLDHTLHYRVPGAMRARALPGCRVRVRVGKRRLVGIVVDVQAQAPDGIELRDVDEILDQRPVLTEELLRLGAFVADYYMAPIGETLRALVPARLPSWGAARVRVTRRGAFLASAPGLERAVVDALLAGGDTTLADLGAQFPGERFEETLDALERDGYVAISGGEGSGSRYRAAVELPAGDLDRQLEAAGRSAPGRAVVDYLAALGRPATVAELTAALGCSAGVVRRLVQRGVLRTFTQIERLSLQRHLMREGPAAAARNLNDAQASALDRIGSALEQGRYQAFLLHGVTGSGKTEVYLRAVERALDAGRSAIVLVPEISLVPALATEARRRFGERLAILHSALGEGERAQEWERARSGRARVVLGPRSAVFAPVEGLGIVVVDEEHDPAFKQEHSPRYHARDLALMRAREAGAVAVLASATPSLESRRNVDAGKLAACDLPHRVGGGRLPDGILVDLRAEPAIRKPGEVQFSTRLLEEMRAALDGGEQVILLRNRRGYAPVLLCRACGDKLSCDDCGLPRTLHRRDARLVCHYCGSARPVPASCPRCQAAAYEPIGAGTERVEERVKEAFPGVGVDVLDRDATRRIGGAAAVLERFGSGRTRILVGTQMVAKGHHFPNVGLTAVLAADSYLGFPDFRAVERTYSMLTQLAGRAGRGDRPGRVVIQTYFPDHYAIRAALAHDDAAFAAEEMRFRRVFHYPPFTRMVQLVVRGRDREKTGRRAAEVSRLLLAHPLAAQTRVSGPAPAPLDRLQGNWRFQILLRHASGRKLHRLVAESLTGAERADVLVDVDPQDLF